MYEYLLFIKKMKEISLEILFFIILFVHLQFIRLSS